MMEHSSSVANIGEHLRLSSSSSVYPSHTHNQDLPILVVNAPLCQATIALQGAQLLEFTNARQQSLLWLSPAAVFAEGKALRGGIPLCLPWFGKLADQPDKPQHGFLRNEEWQLHSAELDSEDHLVLCWRHDSYRAQPHALFNWRFEAALTMRLGNSIGLILEITNHDSTPMPLSCALHSYHPVSDLDQVRIEGLEDCEYLDNTRHLQRARQQGPIRFGSEFDRIYLDVPDRQRIVTTPGISVEADNFHSAIVWNPGPEKASDMADLGVENYRRFICLERGNAADNSLSLAPGETHRGSVVVSADQR